jgi:bifunctional DNase/RNase
MFRIFANWLAKGRARQPIAPASSPPSPSPAIRRCDQCEKPQVMHITYAKGSEAESELHLCEDCARRVLARSNAGQSQPRAVPADPGRDVPVEVDKVVISEIHEQQVVVFRDAQGNRVLPFVLGIFEATAIDRCLKGLPAPRPLTHDGWLATIDALGAKIQSACVHDLQDHTYYAELRLSRGADLIRVDVRPSDALLVTLKAKAPFYFAEGLLHLHGVDGSQPA